MPVLTSEKILLNVGCGPHQGAGAHIPPEFVGPQWREIRIDVEASVEPDICVSMTDLKEIEDEFADAVWAKGCIEHLYPHEVGIVFSEFHRVLARGGIVAMTTPDLERVCDLIPRLGLGRMVYESTGGPVAPVDMIFGHRAAMARGERHMAHHTGFTRSSLRRHLIEAGFTEVEVYAKDVTIRPARLVYNLLAVGRK